MLNCNETYLLLAIILITWVAIRMRTSEKKQKRQIKTKLL